MIPPDWAAAVAAGDMAWTPLPPANITQCYYPGLGNGFLGYVPGPQPKVASPDYGACGWLYLAGVHNGPAADPVGEHPSHRAALPDVVGGFSIRGAASGATVVQHGAAIDYRAGVFLNRTSVDAPDCPNTLVETRVYAHRAYRDLLVWQLVAAPNDTARPWGDCYLPVAWAVDGNATAADVGLTYTPSPGNGKPALYTGSTLVPEVAGVSPLVSVAVAFSSLPLAVAAQGGAAYLYLTPTTPSLSVLVVAHSSLDTDGGPSAVAAASTAAFSRYMGLSDAKLYAAHTATMAAGVWPGGIEVGGNATLGAIVNSSLYHITTSGRPDWRHAPTPGSLAGNGYGGHVFWDWDTWMVRASARRAAGRVMRGVHRVRGR